MVIALIAGLCAIPAFLFLSMGAWPVFGFLGLDIAIVFGAFHFNHRAARAYETVILTENTLSVRHVTPSGKARAFELDPNWAKLQVKRSEDGVEDVVVKSRDKAVAIGRFLSPGEKESFAEAFAPALRQTSQFRI